MENIDRNEFDRRTDPEQTEGNNGNSEVLRVIPVIEEQLHVGKEVVDKGKVRITKKVHQEEVIVNDLILRHDETSVERITVNKYVETAPQPVRYEGDKMIISVLKEVMVVEKRILLVEEVHVTKNKVETESPHHITLRKEEVVVERIDTGYDHNSSAV